jgi:Immunity protein 26
MSIYELTNRQRRYLGLNPVLDHWERVVFSNIFTLYFEGDTIVKMLNYERLYAEYDTNVQTNQRLTILPKTSRGKERKLNYTSLSTINGDKICFRASSYTGTGSISVVNMAINITFIQKYKEEGQIFSCEDIDAWIENFIINSPENHFEWLEEQLGKKRVNIKKIKAGDIFAIPISRFEYMFARVLVSLPKLRKDDFFTQHHGMNNVMGTSLLVIPYAMISDNLNINLDELIDSMPLLSDYVMDNNVYYGEYPIIGHREIREQDMEFPISFGHATADYSRHYLQWGFGHFDKPCTDESHRILAKAQSPYGNFRNDGVGFSLHITKTAINEIVSGDLSFYANNDLRLLRNKTILEEILVEMGFYKNITYDDFCKKSNCLILKEQLDYLNKTA